jgi:hypothetical protein
MRRRLAKTLLIMAAVSVLGVPGMVQAATITFSDSHPLTLTNWNAVLNLPRFDPALGTLTGIKFRLDGNVIGDVRFESLDAAPKTVTTFLQATVTLFRPDFTPLVITLPVANNSDNVTAYDGVLDFGGTSGRSYLGLTAADADSVLSPPPPSDLVTFTGVTPISLPISGVGASHATGGGNLVTSFRTSVAAKVTVTYVYDPWPVGACCNELTGECAITTQAACGFHWLGVDVPCTPATCGPPVPVERESWGRIKNSYR